MRGGGFRLAGPIIALAIVMLGIGSGVKAQCLRSTGTAAAPQLDWSGGWPWHRFCYSDLISLYGLERLTQPGAFPYKTSWVSNPGTPAQQRQYMEYPVLGGLFLWANVKLTQKLVSANTFLGRLPEGVFFKLSTFWLSVAWLVVVWAVMGLSQKRRWDAALVAGSPLLITQAFTNFDALAVAFATLGLLAWARRRPVLAGVLLGLGGATKLYPLFLLIPLLGLCWRAREGRAALRLTAGAAGAWIAVNAPIAALFPSGWAWFFKFSQQRSAGFESLYSIISYFTHWGGFDGPVPPNHSPNVLNTVSGLLFIGCCVAIMVVARTAPQRPRVPQLCLLTVVAFLLTSKIYSPQYSLWLVPLAVLALPRPWLLLGWMTIDALVWIPTMLLQLPIDSGGVSQGVLSGAILVRDAALLVICGFVLRDIYRPAADVVRQAYDGDPCGGPLGAPAQVAADRGQPAVGVARL